MKTALLVLPDSSQVVLTPENDFERDIIRGIQISQYQATIEQGSFYRCQGGWDRELSGGDWSLMIIMQKPEVKP